MSNFTLLLVVVAMLQASAGGIAQTITLNEKNIPLEKVFTAIEKQSGYYFVYNSSQVKQAKPVTIDVSHATLEQVLVICFKDQPLAYTVVDNLVVVKSKEKIQASFQGFAPGSTPFNPIDIKGRVTNESGDPISGVTVTIKGRKQGTFTNREGEFSLSNMDQSSILIFSGASVETFEVKVEGRAEMVVKLTTKVNKLDEVQVIGYGSTIHRLNIGDVTTVGSDAIEKQPVGNSLLALEGRVPGMFITQNSGVPGGSVSVQIRGINTISQGKDPLYVIDGVPYVSQFFVNSTNQPGLGGGILGLGGANPFSFINPADIASVDILKDADATSIYGSRGANGVVLITTKKGKIGSPKISINMQSGVGKITRKAKLMNTQQYLQMRKQAFMNDGVTPSSTDLDVNGTWSNSSYTDWQDIMIGGTASYTDIQASLSGGTANAQYLVGTGYHNETTVFPSLWNDRKGSLHFNLNSASVNQKFKMTLFGSYMSDNNRLPTGDYTSFILLAPNGPSLYRSNGTLDWTDYSANPFSQNLKSYTAKTDNLLANGLLSYLITRGLEIKSSFGYNSIQLNENTATPNSAVNPIFNSKTASASFNNNNIKSWIIEPQLTYKLSIGSGRLSSVIGSTFQQRQINGQIINGSGYPNDALLGSLAGAATISSGASIFEQYKYTSAFGRLSYNFDDKYLVNITARRDGSSRFGPGRQFGNFGSFGAAWLFSNEMFIQKIFSFLSFGKLRLSYGTSGNEPGDNYKYLELYNFVGNNPYQGGTSLTPNNLPSPDFAWEVNKKFESGLELGIFKDRILFAANYYLNRSSNQLVGYNLPSIVGFQVVTSNLPAIVQNSGWEFSLNTINLESSHFTWSSAVNFSASKNRLVSFPNISNTSYGSTYTVGLSLNAIKVFHFASVDPATGVYEFYDKNGKLTFSPNDPNDRIGGIVNTDPKFYGGFQNTFKYRNWQLDILFQFVSQTGKNYLYTGNLSPGTFTSNGTVSNQPLAILNSRWQKPGDMDPYQKFSQTTGGAAYNAYGYAKNSNLAYTDASFVRLKNISISYRIKDLISRKMHLDNLRFYAQAQNLITITKYNGIDPENQSIASLPPLRIITAGIQIGL